jgi:hypothetical protein
VRGDKLEENIKMSLEDYPRFVNDNDPELAIAKALFLSTRPNSHKFNLSEEVLREWSPTILGKFLVGNLNVFESDVMSHERKPDIFGYVPDTQEVEFVRADDGYLDAYVNIVVSKIYATEVYNLFLDDNFRNVSVEMRVLYSDEESKDVAEFHIAGLTVLGKTINPSVPRAHMEMVRFSADDAKIYYDTQMKCASEENEVLRKLNAIYDKIVLNDNEKQQVEDNMAKLEEENKDVVMEQPTEVTEEVKEEKLAEDTDKKEEEEVKEEKASDDSDSDDKEDGEDKEEDEKASEDSDEKKEDEDKLAKSEAHCAELEAKCSELEEKLSVLEKFKADVEEEKKMTIVTQTLAQVKESMDAEMYAKFEEKANDCTIDTINAWRNEVLANVATVLMSAKKEESHLRMSMEDDVKTPTSLWDRM